MSYTHYHLFTILMISKRTEHENKSPLDSMWSKWQSKYVEKYFKYKNPTISN